MVAPGLTEREVALELEFFMRRNGSDDIAFEPIVASGPNSARPHAGVSDRVIGSGEFLKLDFGARSRGYCSDMTRTVVVGSALDRHREIYEAVRAANEVGVAAVSCGSPRQGRGHGGQESLTAAVSVSNSPTARARRGSGHTRDSDVGQRSLILSGPGAWSPSSRASTFRAWRV